VAKNIPLTELLKLQIEREAERLREQGDNIRAEMLRIQFNDKVWGLDDLPLEPSERYTDLMKRVQENADVAMVHAGLRTISIKAEPVADEPPPALPAPPQTDQ
jgi:hypothetical protein